MMPATVNRVAFVLDRSLEGNSEAAYNLLTRLISTDPETQIETTEVLEETQEPEVWRLLLEVLALHTWRGDLTVELKSPSGDTATLRSGGGGSADDLRETWTSESHSELAGLTGASGAGTWTLRVIDTARRDVGTLEYVRIACT